MKGIAFGLLYQFTVAIGLIWVAGVGRSSNAIVKANTMLAFAGAVAFLVLALFALNRSRELMALSRSDILQLALGGLLILVVGETLYLAGLAASSATTMAFTALAFPAIALLLELALGRLSLQEIRVRDYVGIGLVATGFLLIASRGVVRIQ